MWASSAAPVAADTIGGTIGISQYPKVLSTLSSWRVNMR
jgi:hypothetical protein